MVFDHRCPETVELGTRGHQAPEATFKSHSHIQARKQIQAGKIEFGHRNKNRTGQQTTH